MGFGPKNVWVTTPLCMLAIHGGQSLAPVWRGRPRPRRFTLHALSDAKDAGLQSAPVVPAKINSIFRVLDTNSDGLLSRDEVCAGAWRLTMSAGEAMDWFDHVDLNSDGVLSREELSADREHLEATLAQSERASAATPDLIQRLRAGNATAAEVNQACDQLRQPQHLKLLSSRELMTFLGALGRAGRWEEQVKVIEHIRRGEGRPLLDTRHYSTAITACARAAGIRNRLAEGAPTARSFVAACDLLEYMRTDGVERDTVVLNSVLNACAKAGETDMAMKILRDLQAGTRDGCEADVFSYASAIDACANARPLPLVSLALSLLDEAKADERVILDAVPYNSCIHAFVLSVGAGTVVESEEAYQKAMDIFRNMPADIRTTTTFNTAIDACRRAARHDEVIELFEEMRRLNYKAPSHHGRFTDSKKPRWMRSGAAAAACVPDATTFTAAVEAYVQLGRFSKASKTFDLAGEMNAANDYGLHHALLEGCKAAVVGLDQPTSSSSPSGKETPWAVRRAQEVRRLAKERGLAPKGARASVILSGGGETNKIFAHSSVPFAFVNDAWNDEPGLSAAVMDLVKAVQHSENYEPDVGALPLSFTSTRSLDHQHMSLAHHAEKKALAAILLEGVDENGNDNDVVITVNFRMCGDCHTFFKAASANLDRRLVVDDGHSAVPHVFEGGVCSCRDAWRPRRETLADARRKAAAQPAARSGTRRSRMPAL